MNKLSHKQQKIIGIILKNGAMQSSAVYDEMVKAGEDISLVTVKRTLSEMIGVKALEISGSGRSTTYSVTASGRVFADVDAGNYCVVEPDKRYGSSGYNFDLFDEFPTDILEDIELKILDEATAAYKQRTEKLSEAIQKKELERFIIELSWKSSKIEGNTYTLLDTEKLILENKEPSGYSKNETRMILNHKDAFNFARANIEIFKTLNRANLEKLHRVLVKDLNINFGFRSGPVGITGSKYRPLDNTYQIQEAVDALSAAVERIQIPYAKALLALLGISYIQPFEDGNKRTSRLMANALLMSNGLAPLSYRSVDENDYREAMIVFYELNSIIPFKKIFIGQYEFASKNYAAKPWLL